MKTESLKDSIILLIDDQPEQMGGLFQYLTQSESTVLIAQDGEQALEIFNERTPDIVLLDINMPGMDGFEVCRRIKACEEYQHIPVIFMTGFSDDADKIKGFEVGGVDFITKPFRLEEISARIQTHVALRKAQLQVEEKNTLFQKELTERTRAELELHNRNQELSLLYQFAQMLGASLELEAVLQTALEEIQRLLEVVSASFWLTNAETNELICMQAAGPGRENLHSWRIPMGQGITGWVAIHGESALVADTWEDERHIREIDHQTGFQARSLLSIPLRVKNCVIGVLNLADQRVNHFTEKDLRFLESIATTAAIAIENARLYAKTQEEIAERTRTEQALQEANTRLHDANESKDRFFSIISHDLKNAFTVLLGYTETLLLFFETYQRDEIREDIKTLDTTTKNLYALMENLLMWSRLQRGIMKYEPEDVDIYDLALRNINLFSPKASQKKVTLTNSVPEKTIVHADRNMIDTVIRNLVSNALKFTHQGGQVDISAQQHDHHTAVSVKDSGVGIPQKVLADLFTVDSSYSQTGTAGEEGTGLGLPLCKDLVEKNGGTIRCTSEAGQGTEFTFIPGCRGGLFTYNK